MVLRLVRSKSNTVHISIQNVTPPPEREDEDEDEEDECPR